jgi:hypothetical protein
MIKKQIVFSLLFALLLAACSPTTPEPLPTLDVNAVYTQAAATIQADYTQQALLNPTATATSTFTAAPPTPTFIPAATLVPSATLYPTLSGPTAVPVDPKTAVGCYNAALVADVTIPPGTSMATGQKFTKTWRVRNTGTCDWNSDFRIVFLGGEVFGSDTTRIYQKVGAGYNAEISLNMKTPDSQSGTIYSSWQMSTDAGQLFGPVFTFSVVLPGSVVNATTTTTPVASCYNSQLLTESPASGIEMKAGDEFTKIWTVKNTGTCEWTSDFKILYVGGDLMNSDTSRIFKNVGVGSTAEIQLKMIAPSGTGPISSSWQMMTKDGTPFGPIFTFTITLK